MDLTMTQEGTRARFTINGKIDENGAEELKARFQTLNRASMTEVVFDFRNVSHIGSAGIGKLLLFYKDLAVSGGSIKIEGASENICEMFRVLKLDTIFSVSRG
ncbi:STAS domain-containing protein [Desulfonema limicola]|uniref:STAS domain-containing protein n=1 Tax=Desulfonema limicola TaxID=45656 RepID=A0A975B514_9BACT|nr:STAS domain-containing protein [Desulfonema limicola]QTA78917.1 STAS domain-containing protein [Desulfonema limicola]